MFTEVDPYFKGKFQLRAGVLLIAEVALVSFISVAGLLTIVSTRVIKRWRRKHRGEALAEDEPLQPVSILFLLAMFMELIQALANVLSVRWAFQGATTEGHFCTAQSALKQIGNDGAALFTMFLAIMTVIPTVWPALLLGKRNRQIVWGMVAFVCVFWLLMIAIPASTIDKYYGSTGPWCWIPTDDAPGRNTKLNEAMGIVTEYLWFWLASLTCFACYGYIVVKWWMEAGDDHELIREAVVMAWYPIAYFVEIFPQSMVRVANLTGHPPAHGWTILTSVLFASSGWVNVLLWVITGRQFGFTAASARRAGSPDSEHEHDVELAPGAAGPAMSGPNFYRTQFNGGGGYEYGADGAYRDDARPGVGRFDTGYRDGSGSAGYEHQRGESVDRGLLYARGQEPSFPSSASSGGSGQPMLGEQGGYVPPRPM